MKRLTFPVLVAAVALSAAACRSHTQIPESDRATLERDLTGRESERFLRLSYFVTPFFGDASKLLLSHVPPEELRLLEHPDGTPVNPGPQQGIVPAGSRVRITKVEFPTAWVVTERIPYTPRTQPWVYLEIEGQQRDRPYVLVLRQGIETNEQFLSELERYLVKADPTAKLAAWPAEVQEAVRTKRAVNGMPQEALEMAWGYPEVVRREREDGTVRETWTYPGRTRVAYLVDGALERTEVAKGP